MAFIIKPKPVQLPAQQFEFSASPYIGVERWDDGLDMMHRWMTGYFPVGDAFPDFSFAEALKVHRCIADLWLATLRGYGAIELHQFERVRNSEVFAPGFIVIPHAEPPIDMKVPQELRDFDPWIDRSLDEEIPDAKFADYFVDKYYDVFVNEYLFAFGKLRRRSNGKIFQPLDISEHPRHVQTTPKTRGISEAPADIRWREAIDILACT